MCAGVYGIVSVLLVTTDSQTVSSKKENLLVYVIPQSISRFGLQA